MSDQRGYVISELLVTLLVFVLAATVLGVLVKLFRWAWSI